MFSIMAFPHEERSKGAESADSTHKEESYTAPLSESALIYYFCCLYLPAAVAKYLLWLINSIEVNKNPRILSLVIILMRWIWIPLFFFIYISVIIIWWVVAGVRCKLNLVLVFSVAIIVIVVRVQLERIRDGFIWP